MRRGGFLLRGARTSFLGFNNNDAFILHTCIGLIARLGATEIQVRCPLHQVGQAKNWGLLNYSSRQTTESLLLQVISDATLLTRGDQTWI